MTSVKGRWREGTGGGGILEGEAGKWRGDGERENEKKEGRKLEVG